MKRLWILILSVFTAGCSTVSYDSYDIDTTLSNDFLLDNYGDTNKKKIFLNVNDIFIGMTLEEVRASLGEHIVIGYENKKEGEESVWEPIKMDLPYRQEELKGRIKSYDVLYYFSSIQKSDGLVAEDELIPLIFEDQKLIGKGSDFLFKLKNKLSL